MRYSYTVAHGWLECEYILQAYYTVASGTKVNGSGGSRKFWEKRSTRLWCGRRNCPTLVLCSGAIFVAYKCIYIYIQLGAVCPLRVHKWLCEIAAGTSNEHTDHDPHCLTENSVQLRIVIYICTLCELCAHTTGPERPETMAHTICRAVTVGCR